jgi:hypothetical protein
MPDDDGFVTYEPPPRDFNPFEADQEELGHYGYPRRPDREIEPWLRELWERAFARPHKFIKADLAENPVWAERPNRLLEPLPEGGGFKPGGWGGAVLQPTNYNLSPPEQAVVAYGEWTVPTMAPDFDNPNTSMTVGFWTGIDGFVVNGQVLQAGVALTVTGSKVEPWPWVEWFPVGSKKVENFEVNQGDRLSVLVCAVRPDHGFASFQNKTTGLCASAGIDPPTSMTGQTTTSQGATAEWAVEGISADLPNFGAVAFLQCTAGTKTHDLDLSKAFTTEIGGSGGNNLTTSSIVPVQTGVRPRSVLVVWDAIR